MERLKKIVAELENEYNREKQIKLLQKISELLITDYAINACGVVIEPLWVEAYYFHKGKFEDLNDHRKSKQKDGFGKLYLHTEKKISPSNRLGGVDIVLSLGDYYLSFLIKNSLIGGKFCKKEYSFENSRRIPTSIYRLRRGTGIPRNRTGLQSATCRIAPTYTDPETAASYQ